MGIDMDIEIKVFDFGNPPARSLVEDVIDLYYKLDLAQVPYLRTMGELEADFIAKPIEFEDFVNHFFEYPNTKIAVLILDGKSAGFCWWASSPSCAHIYSFYIDEQYRRKGHGTFLMRYVLVDTETINQRISLNVIPINLPAQAFYAKFGFYVSDMTMVTTITV